MKGLIFTLFVITAFAFADESQVVGSPRIVIERDAPGGTEQASVIFEKDHVIVTSNSNFTVNQEGSSYLGKFKLPYNEQLLALKEMLATDFEQLVNVKQTFAILEISENDEQIINHQTNVYLNQFQISTNEDQATRWHKRLLAVLAMIEDGHVIKAVKVKSAGRANQWKGVILPGKKEIEINKCTTQYCIIDNFGKLLP